jgi:hypothetical protein
VTDVIVLVAGATGAVLAAQVLWWLGLIVALVVGHFFLFCNVFRVARPLELAWSVLFVALAGGTIAFDQLGWPVALSITLIGTLLVILAQVRKPSYHGIAWERFNPKLRDWWEAQDNWRGER